MIELKYELDMFPLVKNRSVVNIYPTKLYVDWFNCVTNNDRNYIGPYYGTGHEFIDGLKEFFAAYPIEYELD